MGVIFVGVPMNAEKYQTKLRVTIVLLEDRRMRLLPFLENGSFLE
jgi:hypothetical protein